ncbi:hypothetical protein [Halorussus lipolyticus]|uniref:hypothetical protein n=1 Tax=Halorussus lipolyticus TaxID=3034024 RepID=UPI0023E895B4|nr:hypothetical protein [Halorussus sp. DT80]
MSVGRTEGSDSPPGTPTAFADALERNERVHRTWEASNVRWANQWQPTPDSPTAFAVTDRRVLFETEEGVTSIGYNHIRAVRTDPAGEDLDLSVAFVVCGGLCLLVGLVVATNDFTNGVGLMLLSVMLLVAGSAFGNGPEQATITLVIDNERQRLSFSADEAVGAELVELVEG